MGKRHRDKGTRIQDWIFLGLHTKPTMALWTYGSKVCLVLKPAIAMSVHCIFGNFECGDLELLSS